MKTSHILAALRNASSPAARLAAWQSPVYRERSSAPQHLHTLREALAKPYYERETLRSLRASRINSKGPELSSPEAENPLLWLSGESDPEVLSTTPGRDFLNHCGWYADQYQDETLETYAVILKRFPRLVFYGVLDSCNDNIRVHLDEWQGIDFSECQSDYDAEDARREACKEVIRSNDSSTQHEAEESVEYQRKWRLENDLEENRETLKTLRQSIRALCRELKTLCPGNLPQSFPAAASAVRASLAAMLAERETLISENAKLRESIA